MIPTERILQLKNHPVLKSVGIYTFSNFLAKSASFLLLFIFTNPKYISPSENGVLSLFNNALIFLKPFMSLGIIHSVSVDFFKMEKTEFRNSFTSGFFLTGCVAILSIITCFLFSSQLQRHYGFSLVICLLIPLITFFIFCFDQLVNMLRSNNEPMNFMKANMLRLFVEFGLSVLLVMAFNWRWQGRVAGILMSYLILAVFAIYYFIRRGYLFGQVKKTYVRSELSYALPIIALQMAFFAINSSDKFFLAHFSNDNNETVGIYSIAAIFASVVFTLHHALIQYIFPKIFSLLAQDQPNYRSIRKHFIFYFLMMTVATLFLIAITPVIYHYFINPLYLPALSYYYLFCLGYWLWSVAYFFFSFLLFEKHKKKIFVLSTTAILVSCLLNYYCISRWQATGGAWSVFITCGIILGSVILLTSRHIRRMLQAIPTSSKG